VETVGKSIFVRMAMLLAGAGLATAGGCTNFVANNHNADGVTLFQRGQYQEALQQFQEATYADQNNADGYYNLGATYHRLGRLRNQQDSLARAETCYRQCLERNPNHRDCHRGLAVLLIEEGRTNEAFTSIQAWATQSPSLSEPRMELARLYSEFGNREAATNTLADAVQRNPDDARQWAALGKVREESGNYSQALSNYQHSLEINPSQPDVAQRVVALQQVAARQPLALPPPPGTGSLPSANPPSGAGPSVVAGQQAPPIR
jgi:tetratricopeptide (TPR) repeat protein